MSSYVYRIDSAVRQIDVALAAAGGRFGTDTHLPNPLLFLFHPVFKNKQEITQRIVSPFEKFTLTDFRELIEFYLARNYTFISVDDIPRITQSASNIPHGTRYIGLTFDDGYYNNSRILPLLSEYKIPATFFIAYNHVAENRAFWWDVVSRYRAKEGKSHLATLKERNYLRALTHDEIYIYLKDEFGPSAMEPISDLDRPMTLTELAEFSKHKYVTIGNHTMDHARLINYSVEESAKQIEQAQHKLEQSIGLCPKSISYPDGAYADHTVESAINAGLEVGVTTEMEPNRAIPSAAHSPNMLVGRLSLSGDLGIKNQCLALQSRLPRLSTLRQKLITQYKRFS